MKLYLNDLTVNSIKILLLCNAEQIEPEYQFIALNKGEQRRAEFLSINPDGKVPVLVDDNLTLTESNAILYYLAVKSHSTLWPFEFAEQAKVLRILFWQSTHFNSGVSPFAHQKIVMPLWGVDSLDIDEQQMIKFHRSVCALEKILSKNEYVSGSSMSIADISLAAFFIFSEQAEMPLKSYPHVQSWLQKVSMQSWFIATQKKLLAIFSKKDSSSSIV